MMTVRIYRPSKEFNETYENVVNVTLWNRGQPDAEYQLVIVDAPNLKFISIPLNDAIISVVE
jgi:hypothetical protein